MMAFLRSNTISHIDLSPAEIFDICQEISREYAPRVLPVPPAPAATGKTSPQELLAISEEICRDFAPDFSSRMPGVDCPIKLSPMEIREISETLSLDFAPRPAADVSQIVLLPVDPDHLYAYWNLAAEQLESALKYDNQLTLRIYSDTDGNADASRVTSWFDVAIDSLQAQKKVPLPTQNDQISYSAILGKRNPDNSIAALTHSNMIDAPFRKLIADQSNDRTVSTGPLSQFIITSGKTIHYNSKTASGQSQQ